MAPSPLLGPILSTGLAALGLSACVHDATRKGEPPVAMAIAFVGDAATEWLSVRLIEEPGAPPAALLVVRDAKGWIRYVDAVPLSALDWDAPVEAWTPALALERLRVTTPRLNEYAPYLVPRADAGVGAFWALVDAPTLDRLTPADAPLLCYVPTPGGYLCAAYDPDIARGLAVIEGAS